jgi:hypothetical protein
MPISAATSVVVDGPPHEIILSRLVSCTRAYAIVGAAGFVTYSRNLKIIRLGSAPILNTTVPIGS